jgi:hypothetical protein
LSSEGRSECKGKMEPFTDNPANWCNDRFLAPTAVGPPAGDDCDVVSLFTPNGLLESQVLDRFTGITKLDQGINADLKVHSCILLGHGLIALGSLHSLGSRRII